MMQHESLPAAACLSNVPQHGKCRTQHACYMLHRHTSFCMRRLFTACRRGALNPASQLARQAQGLSRHEHLAMTALLACTSPHLFMLDKRQMQAQSRHGVAPHPDAPGLAAAPAGVWAALAPRQGRSQITQQRQQCCTQQQRPSAAAGGLTQRAPAWPSLPRDNVASGGLLGALASARVTHTQTPHRQLALVVAGWRGTRQCCRRRHSPEHLPVAACAAGHADTLSTEQQRCVCKQQGARNGGVSRRLLGVCQSPAAAAYLSAAPAFSMLLDAGGACRKPSSNALHGRCRGHCSTSRQLRMSNSRLEAVLAPRFSLHEQPPCLEQPLLVFGVHVIYSSAAPICSHPSEVTRGACYA